MFFMFLIKLVSKYEDWRTNWAMFCSNSVIPSETTLVAIWWITMLAYIFFFFLDINRFASPTKEVTSWTNADQSVPCVFLVMIMSFYMEPNRR